MPSFPGSAVFGSARGERRPRPHRRVVFNIKGNDYRVVVAVAYRFHAVYIKFVGTHVDYGAINADEVEP